MKKLAHPGFTWIVIFAISCCLQGKRFVETGLCLLHHPVWGKCKAGVFFKSRLTELKEVVLGEIRISRKLDSVQLQKRFREQEIWRRHWHTHAQKCTKAHVHINTCAYICTHRYKCVHKCTCTQHIYAHECKHMHLQVSILCAHKYTCIHVHR